MDIEKTAMLEAVSKCSATVLSDNSTRAIILSSPIEDVEIASSAIYERDFYPNLFNVLRGIKRSVLISNPGTGRFILCHYVV